MGVYIWMNQVEAYFEHPANGARMIVVEQAEGLGTGRARGWRPILMQPGRQGIPVLHAAK